MVAARPAHDRAARCTRDMEQERLDEAREYGAPQRLNKATTFKIFEPGSQSKEVRFYRKATFVIVDSAVGFVNEGPWTRSSTSSAAAPAGGRRKQDVVDPLSKFPRFHFVNVDGQRRHSPASLSALRAHTMRQVWKEKDDQRKAAAEATRHVESLVGAASSFVSDSETPGHKQKRPQPRTDEGAYAPSIMASEDQLQPVGERALKARPNRPDLDSGLSGDPYDSLVRTRPLLGASWAADMEYIHYCTSALPRSS